MTKNTPMTTHTSGPWAYEPTSGAIYFADDNVEPVIAVINQDSASEEQADADGYLVAAAPDLLEALRPFAEIGIGADPDYQPMIRMDRDAILAARAAIAKATAAAGSAREGAAA